MSGTNNFLQWNPGATGQETDPQYAADSQRTGGATDPSLFLAALANKAFYQWSIMVSALAQMLADKNFNVSDANFNNLKAVLANIVTFASTDLATLFASPVLTGDPHSPDQADADNDQSIANTKFVQRALALYVANTKPVRANAVNGFLQWGRATGTSSVTFPTPYTGTPTVIANAIHGSSDVHLTGASTSGFTVDVTSTFDWIAIGVKS